MYSIYRDKIEDGDLLLWNINKIEVTSDIFLMLVQKTLNIEYSHAGVALRLNGRLFCLEAVNPYVRLIPLSMKDDFGIIHTNMNFTKNHAHYLFSKIGYPYNIIDVMKYALNIKTDTNSYYCTKLVGDFYYQAGIVDNEDAGATPKTLIDSVTASTGNPIIKVSNDRANYHEL